MDDALWQKILADIGSIRALARALNVDRRVVYHWKAHRVPAERLHDLAEAANVKPEEIRPDLKPLFALVRKTRKRGRE